MPRTALRRATTLAALALAAAATFPVAAAVAPPTTAAAQPPQPTPLQTGAYDEAIRTLRPLAQDGNPIALRGWIAALQETGAHDRAATAAAQAAARQVPGAAALHGAALIALGRIAEARAVLEPAADLPGEPGALARIELAALLYRYGDRNRARTLFDSFIDHYNAAADPAADALTAAELIAVGRALVHLARWDHEHAHDALRALDEAVAADPIDHSASIAIGNLFLERYDARQAAATFSQILATNPSHAAAHLGMAKVARLEGSGSPEAHLEAALKTNPNLAPARALLARIRLMDGDPAEALAETDRALEHNPADLEALGTRAAIFHLTGDSAGHSAAINQINALTPTPTRPLILLAELAADHRKYAQALDFARQAAAADPASWTARGLMGLNQLRLGQVRPARANLEEAFAGDPFNLWFKNTLDLLDTFSQYRMVQTPNFDLVLHESEADLLAPYMAPLAERAHAEMSRRYGDAPPGRIRVEVYPRHADFSVRTVGLVGLGALGVSFGPALAIDSPAARARGQFNWASTLWHEIAHSFHLHLSRSEVPRWFSEGLAVHEQRKAHPGWGHQPGVGFIQSLASGNLRPVSNLDRGFSSPRHPGEVAQSYYQASLVFELIERRHGFPAIAAMLRAYRNGADDAEAFRTGLGVDLANFDKEFGDYLDQRFAAAIQSVGSEEDAASAIGQLSGAPDIPALEAAVAARPGRFGLRMALGAALLRDGRPAEAAPHFETALELFPQYGGPDGAHWHLGQIREGEGDDAAAISHYRALLRLNESHYDAMVALADALVRAGDDRGAAEALRRLAHVHPYAIDDHERLAALFEKIGDLDGAVIERRAALALNPVDVAAAHYRLARALHLKGDRAAARRAVLAALEIAPNYEEALELLLELRNGGAA